MSNKPTQIDGTVPVIPTTFRQDESIDCEAIASCVRFAADCGVTAVCLPAYGSEFYKLSEPERFQVFEAAVGAGDRVLVIGQSNHPATVRAVEIAKKNEALGADILRLCVDVGGCLSGEHGVGVEKRDLMTHQFSAADLAQQMDVKDVFDPGWLLNPAKVFPLAVSEARRGG